jgi:hypothetical protein
VDWNVSSPEQTDTDEVESMCVDADCMATFVDDYR